MPRAIIIRTVPAYRVIPCLAALCLFIVFSTLYLLGDKDVYAAILLHYGIVPYKTPFVDIGGVLAAWDCVRQGIAVISHDPCDVLGRAFNNSPFWLAGSFIPLGLRSTAMVGWGLSFLFILSLTFVPPVRRFWELVLVVLATVSPMVVFAVERANPDIILFMLTLLAGFLALGPFMARLAAYFVVLFCASLKYYPLSVLILSVRERISTFFSTNLIIVIVIALFIAVYLPDLERGIPLIPGGLYFGDMLGAKNLPFGLAEIVFGRKAPQTALSFVLLADGLYGLFVLVVALVCRRLLNKTALRSALSRLPPQEGMFLVIGSTLLVGCFFAGQSVGYRGIYFLLVLPGLLAVARDTPDTSLRKTVMGTAVLLIFIMWGEFFRAELLAQIHHDTDPGIVNGLSALYSIVWLAREMAWWWLVSVMTTVLIDFLAKSEAVLGLRQLSQRYLAQPRPR